jgi:hypothetical protein
MPQIKQYGTDNILACWQGFYSAGLVVRAAFQCTLTYIASGRYKLSLAPTSMDDENMAIAVFAQVAPGSAAVYERITWNADGTATITIQDASSDFVDPTLMNIVVYQCTDFVSIIEGPPGNP